MTTQQPQHHTCRMAIDNVDTYTEQGALETLTEECPAERATQPTQQSTQQFTDPRRLGEESQSTNGDDMSDVYCILHPASNLANRATELMREIAPEYTLDASAGGRAQYRQDEHEGQNEGHNIKNISEGSNPCDLVLRLSAQTKNKNDGGYYFGRNASRCDIVLGREEQTKRVSNIHFRIYINQHGTVMLEDQSTNGTLVDGHLLRAKEKENGRACRIVLQHGGVISLAITQSGQDDFRFIVRLPQRDAYAQTVFEANIDSYIERHHKAQYLKQERKNKEQKARPAARELPPDLFAPPVPKTPRVTRSKPEWRGGDKYNKGEAIGRGAFACVYKLTGKFDGNPFAAKELLKRSFIKNGILDVKVDQEMRIMQAIKHPNIVQYIEHIDWEDRIFIVMEYVGGGDLAALIKDHGPLEEEKAKIVAAQLLDALKYLHKKNITHRDIKPDNIMISSLDPFQIKLADFGLSKMVLNEDHTFMQTFCGTLLYCAPEVYNEYREYDEQGRRTGRGAHENLNVLEGRYTHAVDIWSLAGVLFFMLTNGAPYPAQSGTTYQELLNTIMTQALDIRPLQRRGVSEQGLRFIKNMLHTRPEHRATVDSLLSDPWITGAQNPDSYLEEVEIGASQMSLQEFEDRGIVDSEDEGKGSCLTDILGPTRETKDSLDMDETQSSTEESFSYMRRDTPANPGKLFGEVSAFGSSCAIPSMLLPQPVPHPVRTTFSVDSDRPIQVEPIYGYNEHGEPMVMLNPINSTDFAVPVKSPRKETTKAKERRGERSSSIMGADSLVGQLNMQSPSADSPASEMASELPTELATQYATTTTKASTTPVLNTFVTASHRRPREDNDDESLAIRPAKKPMSARIIDIPVPPQVFWDPWNPDTWNKNYPQMYASEFNAYDQAAQTRGQTFRPGGELFESTIRSFRDSRSPSFEFGEARASTELENRHLDSGMAKDHLLPATTTGTPRIKEPAINHVAIAIAQPVVENDFQVPKRILGRVSATPDSALPTISLNLTGPVTSWGRGIYNTIRYPHGDDVRISKYAFKIILYAPGLYLPNGRLPQGVTPGNGKGASLDNMAFYISTKAQRGIQVNGAFIESHNAQDPNSESFSWAKLHHGDIITVWIHYPQNGEHTSFKFECFWGESMRPRLASDQFLVSSGPMLQEIDTVCLAQERQFRNKRAAQEEAMYVAAREKDKMTNREVVTQTNPPSHYEDKEEGGVRLEQRRPISRS
ncbi:hypothetical protein BJ878DRAFT_178598 [Calycina marina]|uniref:non-specific serine/threonine protein kinase n=1 Tax=Calycina marina TaxID=1763456 RepID=A0A9P7YZZ7_9HELO|nr:hypothetical protein BJ878DRAFT_178598 [Calycina marina]